MRAAIFVLLAWVLIAPRAVAAEVRVVGPRSEAAWFRQRVPILLHQVETALSYRDTAPITVRLARTDEQFHSIVGNQPDWVAAVALPRAGTLVVRLPVLGPATGTDAASVVRHELVHLLLPRIVGPDTPIPRWFNEGLAQVVGARIYRSDIGDVKAAAAAGRLLPLSALDREFPSTESAASLAYAEGESAVRYLMHRRGIQGIRSLLSAMKDTGSFGAALKETFDETPSTFEKKWKQWVSETGPPWWVTFLGREIIPTLLFVAALLVILAYVKARRHKRKIYDSLPD